MQRPAETYARARETRSELIALLLASLACTVVLTVSIIDSNNFEGPVAASWLIVGIVLLGLLIIGATAMIVARRSLAHAAQAASEAGKLRSDVLMARAVFEAEPQILIFWDQEDGLKVIANTLHTVAGVPPDAPSLLRFGTWLDARSAGDLKAGLDGLFDDGRPFNLLIKTKAGGHLEADARAAGRRAVLRFRDIAGYKRDLVEVLDQHRHLTRDIKTNRTLLNSLPMPVWIRASEGRLEWINASYVSAVDAASAQEVIDAQIELLDTRQRAMLDKLVGKRDPVARRLQLVVSGQIKAHDVLTVPVEGATASVAIDVAELETAQGELEKQIAAYDRTLNRVSTAVAIFDKDQRLSFYNRAYQKLWELDSSWLDQRPTDSQVFDRLRELSRLPSTAQYRDWKAGILQVYTTKPIYDEHWVLPDGRILHVVAEQRPDGGVTYLFDDQSEQLALESRYRTLIEVQRETLDSLHEGVAVFGTDARLHLFNSVFLQMWQLSRSALLQRPHIDELLTRIAPQCETPDELAGLTGAVTSLSGERKDAQGKLRRRDGAFIQFATTPLPDGGTQVTFADVTTTENYQRALLERNEALVAADRLKTRFISHVSYELRTPLTNIIGFSELLASPRTGPLTAKQREYLSDISASSEALMSIINDILDLATIDAGALELRYETISVRDIVSDAIKPLAERAARARIALNTKVSDDVSEMEADPQRIRQILYNLASNAIGFSNPGEAIMVSCWRDKDEIVLQIVDQGIGIPEKEQTDIFERFVSRSRGSRHRGAGLGLSIVKSLVELHNGSIHLKSERDKGTTVTVRLPMRRLDPQRQGHEPHRAAMKSAASA